MERKTSFSKQKFTSAHGGGVRGSDSAGGSPLFEGRFGRMFRTLPAAEFDSDDLAKLAASGAMISDPEILTDSHDKAIRDSSGFLIPTATPETETDDEENLGIPAGYTYLGQFIDHDITFDPASQLQKTNDPDALVDFRTPRFDLDSLYGRGPDDLPYMYEPDGRVLRLGRTLTANGTAPDKQARQDLVRLNERAVIGDKRNDENVIVSQLQAVFIRFHNAIARANPDWDFAAIAQQVRWHYQWVVLHDFLPRIVGSSMLNQVLPHIGNASNPLIDRPRLLFYHWHVEPYIPVEFSVAAYRFGHSMVRPIYRLNTELGTHATADEKKHGVDGRQFIFARKGIQGLNGFREFPDNWAIDWSLFFEIKGTLESRIKLGKQRVQPAYKIDTSLVNPVAFLPEFSAPAAGNDFTPDKDGNPAARPGQISNLALRNLQRGKSMGLPSGQDVARFMGLEPLSDADIRIGKANVDGLKTNKSIDHYGKSFKDSAPLWTYVLAEALHGWTTDAKSKDSVEAKNSVPVRMGPVGGRIVTEVFAGMLLGDPQSYLSLNPGWKPPLARNGQFTMRELIQFALE
jgi:hypothetical protein